MSFFGELTFEVDFLLICQPFGNTREPTVHGALIHNQLGNALFIKQRRYGFVFHRSLHRVRMHNGAELVGGLVFLE
ncbi:hypothetical protein D3C85_1385080 [compost metagenome]